MTDEAKVVDLGWCVAKLHQKREYLTIMSPSDGSETSFAPAASVSLWRQEDILKLRDFLNQEFPS